MRGESGIGLAAALLVSAPVLVGLGYALLGALGIAGPGAGGGPSLDRIAGVMGSAQVWEGVAWSVWVAASSTALAASLAALLAVAFRSSASLDRLARGLAVLPLPVPHVVAGVLGVLILGQSGLLARLAFALGWISAPAGMPALVYDPPGVGLILTLSWKEVPFLALVAFSVLSTRGELLEEAARTLGASPWSTFRRITWPVLWRGLMPAAVAVFVFALGSYEMAVLLAPSDPLALPLQTMERYTDASLERRGDAYVLALVALVLSLAAVAVHEWVRTAREVLDS